MTLPGPGEWPVDGTPELEADLLAERAASTPEATAVVDADGNGEWTYAALDDRAAACAGWLSDHTHREGRVGVLLDGGMALVDVYVATARLGVPAVPLNVRLDADELRSQTERADVSAVVADGSTRETAHAVTPEGTPVLLAADRPDRAESAPERRPPEPRRSRPPESERLVVFTSGTTGRPKGVRLTRTNLVASAVGSAARLGVAPGDRWLAPLPAYHVGGLAPLVRSTLYGTTTVLQRSFDPEETAAVIDQRGVTGLSLVPTLLGRLLEADWTPPDSLRFVLLGGAPASRELVDRAASRGIPVHPTYGLTETASQVATATPSEARDHPGTVGRPLRTVTVTVTDDGSAGTPGDTGEIVVDGPTVTPGYLDPEETEAAFDGRGLHTGDAGHRDAGGRLWIDGRLDDRIVTGGENVAPDRVREALCSLDGVEDAAVVGLPDEEWGERVAALIVGSPSLTPERVRERVVDSIADFEVPKTVVVTDTLPRTPSGTVDRGAVRERLRRDRRG